MKFFKCYGFKFDWFFLDSSDVGYFLVLGWLDDLFKFVKVVLVSIMVREGVVSWFI